MYILKIYFYVYVYIYVYIYNYTSPTWETVSMASARPGLAQASAAGPAGPAGPDQV